MRDELSVSVVLPSLSADWKESKTTESLALLLLVLSHLAVIDGILGSHSWKPTHLDPFMVSICLLSRQSFELILCFHFDSTDKNIHLSIYLYIDPVNARIAIALSLSLHSDFNRAARDLAKYLEHPEP